jgi:hypothetical protein
VATSKLNPALEQLRGKIGGLVFRQVRGKLVVSSAPDFSRRKLSAAQKAQCRRFADAVRHARAVLKDPQRRPTAAAKATRQSRSVYAVLISDYLKTGGK